MKPSILKSLIIALLTVFCFQLQAQKINTRQDAVNFFSWAIPGKFFYITEKNKGFDGIEKETIYECFDYSLENEYLILLAKNITKQGQKNNSINFMLNLTDSLILNADNYKKKNTTIISMLDLAYRNYKIQYRMMAFEDVLYTKNKRSVSIAQEFRQRMDEFYTAFNALKINLDPNERSDLKLSKFKDEFIKAEMQKEICEDQRKYIVQANAANAANDYNNALLLYRKALDINKFSYPAAYFNMALILSQTEHYYQAIYAMKAYLILNANAEDARKAQDKIYEWELNIKN